MGFEKIKVKCSKLYITKNNTKDLKIYEEKFDNLEKFVEFIKKNWLKKNLRLIEIPSKNDIFNFRPYGFLGQEQSWDFNRGFAITTVHLIENEEEKYTVYSDGRYCPAIYSDELEQILEELREWKWSPDETFLQKHLLKYTKISLIKKKEKENENSL